MDLGVLIPIFGILLVMIPVAGLTLGLTLRLAVRPFVETLAEALRDSRQDGGTEQLSGQFLMLQEGFEALAQDMRELKTAQDFDRTLLADRDGPVKTGLKELATPPLPPR